MRKTVTFIYLLAIACFTQSNFFFVSSEIEDYLVQTKEKLQKFTESVKSNLEKNRQKEHNIQSEVDDQKTKKSELRSKISYQRRERKETKVLIKEIKRKMEKV